MASDVSTTTGDFSFNLIQYLCDRDAKSYACDNSFDSTKSEALTTRGGCSFDELCNGSVQSYACDNVIDITSKRDGSTPTVREAEQMLLDHVDRCVRSIETERGCQLEHFYIGKTHVRQRKGRRFDHMNKDTWKLDGGINSRCRCHREGGYGRDGLVVLTVVTREAIHPDVRRNKPDFHQEDYALVLEGRLIQDCMTDTRLYNQTLEPGGRDKTPSIGYPLYMAFKVGTLSSNMQLNVKTYYFTIMCDKNLYF